MKTFETATTVEGVDRSNYTVPEAAAWVRCSERQMWEWVRNGAIASYKIGRLRRVSHEALVAFTRGSAA